MAPMQMKQILELISIHYGIVFNGTGLEKTMKMFYTGIGVPIIIGI